MITWVALFCIACIVLGVLRRPRTDVRVLNLCDDVEGWAAECNVPPLVHIDYVRAAVADRELSVERKIEIAHIISKHMLDVEREAFGTAIHQHADARRN